MVIEVLNLDELIKNFDKMQKVDMKPFITTATQLVQRTAKDLAPEDTGFLKRSIKRNTYKMGKTVVGRVYTATEYAIYQEFGTYKMKAQSFMIPAMEIHRKDIETGAKEFLSYSLGKFKVIK